MPERIDCAHCSKTGICTSGADGNACVACQKEALGSLQETSAAATKGLPCSVCHGRGSAEPFSYKLQNRFVPAYAFVTTLVLLGFVIGAFALRNGDDYKAIIGFAGPLLGSITTFYFGSRK